MISDLILELLFAGPVALSQYFGKMKVFTHREIIQISHLVKYRNAEVMLF
jgi:hypothetical protein